MTLYVVATPIGNLEDITLRALKMLKDVDLIVAEDTRHTRQLLKHFGISKKIASFHEPREEQQIPFLMAELKSGKSLALVTDAGTPAISDPGFRLMRAAIQTGITVVPIPGACAAITALQAAGLPTDHFLFLGFLPEKPGKRQKYLEELKNFPHTIVVYLSRWKALKQVEELSAIFGLRSCCLAREMTKIHEEFWRGDLKSLGDVLKIKPPKGELTLVIEGAP